MKLRLVAASALALGALVSGCQSTVAGNPNAQAGNPTEPDFPTSRPSRTTSSPPSAPASTTTAPPTAVAPAPGGEVLSPQNGYVFIATKSGKTRCQLSVAEVDCEARFANPPTVDGQPADGVRLTATGQQQWISGNLGDIPVVTIDYRTYSAVGWTIVAGEDGTRFTNDASGRGMVVAIEKVDFF